jgi:titin
MTGGSALAAGGAAAVVPDPILAPAANEPCSSPSAKAPAFDYCLTAAAGDSQVDLKWSPSTPLGDLAIYYGTEKNVKTGKAATGDPVDNLKNGTTYYFWLTLDGTGLNPVSNMVSATPAALPDKPNGLTATPGDSQVALTWAAPVSSGGLPITGYHLYAGTTADLGGASPIATLTGTVVTVTGLVNGSTYYFKVTALNRAGEGPGTETKAVPVTTPGEPTGLTATPGDSQVTLSWAAPASDGGAPISDYIIVQGTSPGGETGDPVSGSPVTGTRTTVTGLVNGTTYFFKVVAVNAAGQGPLSAEASAALLPIKPPPPSPSSTVRPTSTNSPSSSPSGTASPSSATSSPGTTTPSSPTVPSSAGAGSASSTSAPAFAAPTGLTATAGDAQVHLSWAAPPPDSGPPVTGYKVYLGTVPGVRANAALASTTGTAGTVANLVNGTVYYFMVTAVDAAGNESPASTEVSAEPNGPAKGVTVSLDSPIVPKQLTALLAAVAALAAAGVFTLIARHRRRLHSRDPDSSARGRAHSGQQLAVLPDVRAVPTIGAPDTVRVSDTGQQPTQTVRLEPHPGAATTTIKEAGHDDRRRG